MGKSLSCITCISTLERLLHVVYNTDALLVDPDDRVTVMWS